MATAATTTTSFLLPYHHNASFKHQFGIRANQIITTEQPSTAYRRSTHLRGLHLHLPTSLSSLFHLDTAAKPRETLTLKRPEERRTPTSSPREDISKMWRELHGSAEWDGLLDPLHPWLRREIVKYGEFAQATYDAFDFDSFSEYCGTCRYNKSKLFEILGLGRNGYKVTNYLYAMSHVELPRWLERSLHADAWCRDSNWMGYVAVSDDEETRRIGRRDIVVAWRGTVSPSEWFEDFQTRAEPVAEGDAAAAKVEHGFLCMYTSKSEATRCNKSSAQEQVMAEVKRLVTMYREKGEEVSLTITGHSLGGALALLTAHDAAGSIHGLPVTVVSFGAPMAGNAAFKERLDHLGVKVLRVVNKQDAVPKLPGVYPYVHVGAELALDVAVSPYLKQRLDLPGFHGLETYLHLVDGYSGKRLEFREEAKRDVALVNKCSGMLKEELRVPECWNVAANKGMVRNGHGRWVAARREPEDIPSPYRDSPGMTGTPTPCF